MQISMEGRGRRLLRAGLVSTRLVFLFIESIFCRSSLPEGSGSNHCCYTSSGSIGSAGDHMAPNIGQLAAFRN